MAVAVTVRAPVREAEAEPVEVAVAVMLRCERVAVEEAVSEKAVFEAEAVAVCMLVRVALRVSTPLRVAVGVPVPVGDAVADLWVTVPVGVPVDLAVADCVQVALPQAEGRGEAVTLPEEEGLRAEDTDARALSEGKVLPVFSAVAEAQREGAAVGVLLPVLVAVPEVVLVAVVEKNEVVAEAEPVEEGVGESESRVLVVVLELEGQGEARAVAEVEGEALRRGDAVRDAGALRETEGEPDGEGRALAVYVGATKRSRLFL